MSSPREAEKWRALSEISDELDVNGLVASAFSAFNFFIPFYHTKQSFEHQIVAEIISRITSQADLYFAAIGTTLETAIDGCTISDDALLLCQFLEDRNGTIDQLTNYLESMISIATSARERSSSAEEQFRSIRRGLKTICSDIPSEVAAIQEEQRARETNISHGVNFGFLSMPAYLMTHPMDLDRERHLYPQPGRSPGHHTKSFADVLADLQKINADLGQLIKHIGSFADWWQVAETKLIGLQSSINQLTLDGTNPLQHLNVRKKWVAIKAQYTLYSQGISYVQDMHPQILQKKSTYGPSHGRDRPFNHYADESNYSSPPMNNNPSSSRHHPSGSRSRSRPNALDYATNDADANDPNLRTSSSFRRNRFSAMPSMAHWHQDESDGHTIKRAHSNAGLLRTSLDAPSTVSNRSTGDILNQHTGTNTPRVIPSATSSSASFHHGGSLREEPHKGFRHFFRRLLKR